MPLYQGYTRSELDVQYNALATVPDASRILADYAALSAAMRSKLPCRCDVPYGTHADETVDLFPAPRPGGPVLVFIHGGYWRTLSKSDSSFMAEAFTTAGAAVVAVNYSLAPGASLDRIVDQVRRALVWVHRHAEDFNADRRRIHVCGSSAGGHLVGMLLSPGWHAEYGVPEDVVAGACAVSGLFDLTPIPHTAANAWARLDDASARRLSPIAHLPDRHGPPLIASSGEHETAEFLRQTVAYAEAWAACGFPCERVRMPGTNHFDVILALAQRDSPLCAALMRQMGIAAAISA
jgi:arylformamidase